MNQIIVKTRIKRSYRRERLCHHLCAIHSMLEEQTPRIEIKATKEHTRTHLM